MGLGCGTPSRARARSATESGAGPSNQLWRATTASRSRSLCRSSPTRTPDGRTSRYWLLLTTSARARIWRPRSKRQARHDPLTGLPNRSMLEDRMRQLATAAVPAVRWRCCSSTSTTSGHQRQPRPRLLATGCSGRRAAPAQRRASGDTVARLAATSSSSSRDGLTASRPPRTSPAGSPSRCSTRSSSTGARCTSACRSASPRSEAICPRRSDRLIRDADTAMCTGLADGRGASRCSTTSFAPVPSSASRSSPPCARPFRRVPRPAPHQPQVDSCSRAACSASRRWSAGATTVSSWAPVSSSASPRRPTSSSRWAPVLETACRDLAAWQRMAGWEHLGVSVNVSVRRLQQPGFVDLVDDVLRRTDSPGHPQTGDHRVGPARRRRSG